MKTSNAIYFSGCVLLIIFALSYCAVPLFHLKLPRYYPTLRQWKTVKEADVPSMGWYGQTVFAFLLSVPISVLVFFIFSHSFKKELPDTSIWYKLAGGIAVGAVLLMMVFFAWHEYDVWVILN